MREVFRQTVIIGISCLVTLAIWLTVRLLMIHFQLAFPVLLNYLLVMLLYMLVRGGVTRVWSRFAR